MKYDKSKHFVLIIILVKVAINPQLVLSLSCIHDIARSIY